MSPFVYLKKIIDKVNVDDDGERNSKKWCSRVLDGEKFIFGVLFWLA